MVGERVGVAEVTRGRFDERREGRDEQNILELSVKHLGALLLATEVVLRLAVATCHRCQ